jgi:2-(1,2-epoxy-1,2-dihydrophenyl)acetyl-CoA isomerase
MQYKDIIYEKENHIAKITLNRPERMNSFSTAMNVNLRRALKDAEKDKNIRVIILTGTGRAFCSGADVKEMADTTGKKGAIAVYKKQERNIPIFGMLRNIDKPVIAAVNGVAVGGGCDLALACDIRIASEKARFAEVYIRRGLFPECGGTYFLPRLIGIDKALLMLWTGDMIDAREAEKLGIVTMVVPHEDLEMTAMELAEKLAKSAPLAIQRDKRAVYDGLKMDLDETLKYAEQVSMELRRTKDHQEGATAFVEKREPVFKGE